MNIPWILLKKFVQGEIAELELDEQTRSIFSEQNISGFSKQAGQVIV